MNQAKALLTDFHLIRPHFEKPQDELLEWLAQTHARAEHIAHPEEPFERGLIRMRKLLARFGCSSKRIGSRGTELWDGTHLDFSKMEVYPIQEGSPVGVGMLKRTQVYAQAAERVLNEFYEEVIQPPGHVVHVTCTGYASPSAAQVMVDQKKWSGQTSVTHAYHMGCYASLPAIRIGAGLLASEKKNVDIVHTELCSLHMNPLEHSPEQLVIYSLFADGHIKYTLRDATEKVSGLELLDVKEYLIPGTKNFMTWITGDSGMKMTLSKDVPGKVAEVLPQFLKNMLGDATEEMQKTALFAVHPGGPKIIDSIQSLLELAPEQIAHSRDILYRYGNMSSATLPHVWQSMLEDPAVLPGQLIVALAFGPGLTVFGALLRKRAAIA